MHRKGVELLFQTTFRRISALSTVSRTPPCSCLHLSRHLLSTEQSVQKLSSAVPKEPITDFSNLNPDEFGTLTLQKDVNEVLDEMPEEEDDKVEFLIEDETGRKVRRNMNYYVSLIIKFIKERKIADAIDVLEERMLKRDKVKPNYFVYNLLINGCAKVGYTLKAFKLYNQMKKRNLKITSATYTGLFNACANSLLPEDALIRVNNLRRELVEKGIELNDIHYNALIKAYARLNDVRAAFLVVDEMISRRFPLTDGTFVFLLQACASDREAGFRHALILWHKMKKKRIPRSIFTYNQFLRCVRDCGIGDVQETLAAVKEIAEGRKKEKDANKQLESGVKNDKTNLPLPMNQEHNLSDDFTDSSGIHESSECNDLSILELKENRPNLLAPVPHLGSIIKLNEIKTAADRLLLLGGFRNVLEEMEIDKVEPDIKTFTLLLDMIPSTLSAEEALIKKLKQSKIPIDIDFCNMLIKKRAYRGDYENGRATLELIQSLYLTPDIVTFGVLALCCRTVPEAQQLIKDMRQFGYRLNAEILGGMLANACYCFNYEYVVFIMKLTKNMNIQPSEEYLEHLRKLSHRSSEYYNAKSNRKKGLPHEINPRSMEFYKMFKDYYKQWKNEVTVYVPPHPYEQFKVRTEPTEAEEEELSNILNASDEKNSKHNHEEVKHPGAPTKWKRSRNPKAQVVDMNFQHSEERRKLFNMKRNSGRNDRELTGTSVEKSNINWQTKEKSTFNWQTKNDSTLNDRQLGEGNRKNYFVSNDGEFREGNRRSHSAPNNKEFGERNRRNQSPANNNDNIELSSERKILWQSKSKQ